MGIGKGALRDGDAVSLKLKSDPRNLCLVRAMIRSFGGLVGFDEALAHRITLAVDEGCTNIIRHAHGGNPEGDIEVTCRVEELAAGGRRLIVSLIDDGKPIDCGAPPTPLPPDPLTPGGLGLQLMRDIMDDVRFSVSVDGRNLLELTLACPEMPESEPSSSPS